MSDDGGSGDWDRRVMAPLMTESEVGAEAVTPGVGVPDLVGEGV